MSKLVEPKVYFVGQPTINRYQLRQYLIETDQLEFVDEIVQAEKLGLSDGEILCSFFAKSCYKALTDKKNKNISKVRAIEDNIKGTIKSGHGSVFEHCTLNFMITNCSRVFTHELVRHRVGTAFSQTSGRYVRSDELELIFDPILDPIKEHFLEAMTYLEDWYVKAQEKMNMDSVTDFGIKKKITSALRRILPNGQGNEIGFSVNLRSLRHILIMRTSRHAEREIRIIANQIYDLVKDEFPAFFFDAKLELVDGILEITFEHEHL